MNNDDWRVFAFWGLGGSGIFACGLDDWRVFGCWGLGGSGVFASGLDDWRVCWGLGGSGIFASGLDDWRVFGCWGLLPGYGRRHCHDLCYRHVPGPLRKSLLKAVSADFFRAKAVPRRPFCSNARTEVLGGASFLSHTICSINLRSQIHLPQQNETGAVKAPNSQICRLHF